MTYSHKSNTYLVAFFAGLFIFFLVLSVYTGLFYFTAIPFGVLFFYAGWQSFHFVFFLLLFSLPFSVEYQFSPSLGTDFPDELLMLLTATFFVFYWVYDRTVLSKKTIQHPLVVFLLIGFIWSIVSVVFSTEPLISFKYLLAKSWYICAFVVGPLIVFSDKKVMVKAAKAVTIAMILVTVIIMIRHSAYGFSFGGINKALQPFFRNHVNYSAMLVCIIPIVFVFRQNSKRKLIKLFFGLMIIILLAALYFSYARGAWLALIVGIIAVWLIKRKLLFGVYIIFIVLIISSVFWLRSNDRYLHYAHNYKTTIWHEDFSEHIKATYELKDMSTAERFYRWIAGVRMIKDDPLTGYGPNSFYYNYKPYAIPAFKTWVSDNKERSTIHNYFLLVLVEQGVPGLFFFLLLTAGMLFYAQRLYHRTADKLYKSAAITTGVIIMMILTVNFLSDLIETDKVGSLFYLCLSVLVVIDVNSRTKSNFSPDVQGVS